MPLVEALAVSVGPAIAKAILKSWLKEGVALDVISSIPDALKSSISDAFARERTADQFKVIGRQVAESLKHLYESEGVHLTDEEQECIARALADTLNGASINPIVLLQHDLNPTTLFQSLRTKFPVAKYEFSDVANSFYERLLKETCKYVVNTATSFPTFGCDAFRAMIEKENELLRLAQRIRDDLDRIRVEALKHNPEALAREFEADYLQEIVQALDEVKLFGTDLTDAQRRYGLSVAYVTLSVRESGPEATQGNDWTDAGSDGTVGPVDETLARSSRLLVRGLAGSGKTTLLQWLAVQSAGHRFTDLMTDWNDTIPFLIRLREFAKKDLPNIDSFPQLISPYVRVPPEGWTLDQLKSGRALILIDGVDEIPMVRRETVREWIRGITDRFLVRVVVTSRPHAVDSQKDSTEKTVEDGWLESLGFAEADLQPMDLESTLAFVDNWRDAVCAATPDIREHERLKEHLGRLKQTIEERLPVRDLATSPLLCAMLCSLHRNKAGQIPTRRIELYEACVKMLLARDAAREIDQEEYPHLDSTQKRPLLEHIAYWMLENGYSSGSLEDVEVILEPRIRALRLPESDTTSRVLRLLVDRTGIVREPSPDRVDFAHRTFLEYLAAHHALDSNRLGALLKSAHDDNFRETIILAAGIAKRELRTQSAFGSALSALWPAAAPTPRITEGEGLIKGLIRRGDREPNHRPALHLLAVACLETAVELSDATRKEVEQRLARLGPPRNIPQALAFASADEMALPFLERKGGQSVDVAAACVRALAHIGGPLAMSRIEAYALDPRKMVVDELHRAWERFDREEYARRVLEVAHPDRYLKVEKPAVLRAVRYYVCLKTLDIRGEGVSDLAPLAGITGIATLILHRTSVSDLTPLAGMTALTRLDVEGTQVSDLTPLAGMTALTTLDVGGTQVSDLTPLAGMTALTRLYLNNTQVTDLTPLAGLTALADLQGVEYTELGKQWQSIQAGRKRRKID